MKGRTIIHIAPSNTTYYMWVDPHIYLDETGLLLMAATEGDGAMDEVGATIVVEADWGWSVSSRCVTSTTDVA